MQAVKHGVTRHHVLGLELALATGEVIRTGGRIVKASSGYDLTQLVIGSEGTLALVTEATLKLVPRPAFSATVLAPFPTLDEVAAAVPKVITSGLAPSILEYIDMLTMAAIRRQYGLELGIPEDVQETALAYLVVRMESDHDDRLDADVHAVAELLVELGAADVYVLPPNAAAQLIEAREKAFWLAKSNGADDIVDIAVPRRAIPEFMAKARSIGEANGAWIAGCGHAGDGNVHLAVFQKDAGVRKQLMLELFAAGIDLGGVISGEHGIGTTKKPYFLALEDPTKVDAHAHGSSRRSTPRASSIPARSSTWRTRRERGRGAHPHARRQRRRHVLHESRDVGDALRRGARRGSRHARRARTVRRRRHRSRRRLCADQGPPGRCASPPRPGTRQRSRQPAQRAQGQGADRQHRR